MITVTLHRPNLLHPTRRPDSAARLGMQLRRSRERTRTPDKRGGPLSSHAARRAWEGSREVATLAPEADDATVAAARVDSMVRGGPLLLAAGLRRRRVDCTEGGTREYAGTDSIRASAMRSLGNAGSGGRPEPSEALGFLAVAADLGSAGPAASEYGGRSRGGRACEGRWIWPARSPLLRSRAINEDASKETLPSAPCSVVVGSANANREAGVAIPGAGAGAGAGALRFGMMDLLVLPLIGTTARAEAVPRHVSGCATPFPPPPKLPAHLSFPPTPPEHWEVNNNLGCTAWIASLKRGNPKVSGISWKHLS